MRGLFLFALVVLIGSVTSAALLPPESESFAWNLPKGFPAPRVPASNPMTSAKVELGRHLFYDTRLSGNGQQSCGTCHEQARAFTDGRERAVGSTGEVHPRNAMSLANVAYAAALTWGNPTVTRLEDQALVPMFGDHPVELGLTRPGTDMLERLRREPRYGPLFAAAFSGLADPFTLENVTKAIASFERTILSGDSSYDRYKNGDDPGAITEPWRIQLHRHRGLSRQGIR